MKTNNTLGISWLTLSLRHFSLICIVTIGKYQWARFCMVFHLNFCPTLFFSLLAYWSSFIVIFQSILRSFRNTTVKFAQLFINKKKGTCSLSSLVYSLPRFLDARVNKIIIIAARIGQLPIFVLKASENSICREVCLEVCKFVSLFYQFPVPAA